MISQQDQKIMENKPIKAPSKRKIYAVNYLVGVLLILASLLLGYFADVVLDRIINMWAGLNLGDLSFLITEILMFAPVVIGLAAVNNKAWQMFSKPQPKVESLSDMRRFMLGAVSVLVFFLFAVVTVVLIWMFKEAAGHTRYISEKSSYLIIVISSFLTTILYNLYKKSTS